MYNISVYYTMGYPEDVPDDAKEFFKIFDETPGLKVKSTDDLVELLFQNTGFIALASFGADEDMAFVAFEIMLEEFPPGVLNTDADGFVNIKDARLQLIFNEQNPNPVPDHAYNLAYPETSISSQEDIVILHDEEKARLALKAWRQGLPFVDDDAKMTYSLNEETGEYELQPFFDDDMA